MHMSDKTQLAIFRLALLIIQNKNRTEIWSLKWKATIKSQKIFRQDGHLADIHIEPGLLWRFEAKLSISWDDRCTGGESRLGQRSFTHAHARTRTHTHTEHVPHLNNTVLVWEMHKENQRTDPPPPKSADTWKFRMNLNTHRFFFLPQFFLSPLAY